MSVTADNVAVRAGMTICDSEGRKGRVLCLAPPDQVQHLMGGTFSVRNDIKYVVVMDASPDTAKQVAVFNGYYASNRGLLEKRITDARNRVSQADETKRKATAEIQRLTDQLAALES